MRYSVPVRNVGQSRCRYRVRAIEYEPSITSGSCSAMARTTNLSIESGLSAARCCTLASGIP